MEGVRVLREEAVAFVAAVVGDAVIVHSDHAGIGLDLMLVYILAEAVGRGSDEQGV